MELVQHLKQQQILAPQMILSMDILLLTQQELRSRLEKEFMENPALELAEKETSSDRPLEEAPATGDRDSGTQEGVFEQLDNFQNLPAADLGWKPKKSYGSSDFDRQEALQNIEGVPPGLRDYLLQQLRLLDLPRNMVEIGEFIVNDIDERGYLLNSAESLRESLAEQVTSEDFWRALEIVRSLDPPGVGAENLQECLLLQLERDRQPYPLETKILQKHV